jgi:DNA-directed RNA polymerase specialized sigma24 family protein
MKLISGRTKADGRLRSRHATGGEVQEAFNQYREGLDSLALFLTGDPRLAEACIVDARALASTHNHVFEEWLEHWARRATILSAIDMQKTRIAQLASAYERCPCPHQEHASTAPEIAELLNKQGEGFIYRTDVLCRCALVLRGIENYSSSEAALMLNISRAAFNGAYCAALQSLAIVTPEMAVDLAGIDSHCVSL